MVRPPWENPRSAEVLWNKRRSLSLCYQHRNRKRAFVPPQQMSQLAWVANQRGLEPVFVNVRHRDMLVNKFHRHILRCADKIGWESCRQRDTQKKLRPIVVALQRKIRQDEPLHAAMQEVWKAARAAEQIVFGWVDRPLVNDARDARQKGAIPGSCTWEFRHRQMQQQLAKLHRSIVGTPERKKRVPWSEEAQKSSAD